MRPLLSALLLLLSGCSSLLYSPAQEKLYDPKELRLEYQEIHFNSAATQNPLVGWYFPSRAKIEPRALIVFFHGNGENLSSHFLTLSWLPQYGFEYFIFDYQGYGQSPGDPSPEHTVQDGMAALQWSKKRADELGIPLIVFSQSLGGTVAMRSVIESKKDIPIQLFIIDSSFESYQSEAASVLSRHWVTWIFQPFAYFLISDRWSPEGRLSELAPVPLLFIHGTADQTVDFKLGKELFDASPEPKEFWEIPGGRHTDALGAYDGKYRQQLLSKLDKLFPKRQKKVPESFRTRGR